MDVSVKVPSGNKKTSYIREVLCSKKQGDILYVPAVESLAGCIQHNSESTLFVEEQNSSAGAAARLRRTSARLASMLIRKQSTSARSSIAPGTSSLVDQGLDDMGKFSTVLHEERQSRMSFRTLSPKSKATKQSEMALKRIEKLMNHLDMTTVTAPYGATLLRLDSRLRYS